MASARPDTIAALLSPDEAASMLGIGRRTLRDHVQAGRIRYIVVGAGRKRPRIAFAGEDLEEFTERQRRRAAPIKEGPCPSIGKRAARSTPTTSDSRVVAFRTYRRDEPPRRRARRGPAPGRGRRCAEGRALRRRRPAHHRHGRRALLDRDRPARGQPRQCLARPGAPRHLFRSASAARRYPRSGRRRARRLAARAAGRTQDQVEVGGNGPGPGGVSGIERHGQPDDHADAAAAVRPGASGVEGRSAGRTGLAPASAARTQGARARAAGWRGSGALRRPPEDYEVFLEFALASGLRVSEALLEWRQVDFAGRRIVKTGKGGQVVSLVMSERMAEILASRRGHHALLVFTYTCRLTRKNAGRVRGERYPITIDGLKSVWRRARASAGVEDFRWHDSRHTFATRLLRDSGNLKLVQRALNHASINTTTKYAHVLDDEVREAMNRVEDSRKDSRTLPRRAG